QSGDCALHAQQECARSRCAKCLLRIDGASGSRLNAGAREVVGSRWVCRTAAPETPWQVGTLPSASGASALSLNGLWREGSLPSDPPIWHAGRRTPASSWHTSLLETAPGRSTWGPGADLRVRSGHPYEQ